VAINAWKAKLDRLANHECAVCGKIVESILHRFQDFRMLRKPKNLPM
jgi:hypothetical protein